MNRRELFQGRQADDGRVTYVSSVVVSTLPQRLKHVSAQLALIMGVEVVAIHNHKFVLLLEASGRDAIGALLAQISLLDGVLSASLVFEGSCENDEDAA
jgi:nitrate reductase NapD